MKANKAPKSKFVYPGKLYARCNNNKTLDISYVPQSMEAVEYTHTDVFIEKACEWWKNELTYPTMTQAEIDWYQDKIEAFKKYMEE